MSLIFESFFFNYDTFYFNHILKLLYGVLGCVWGVFGVGRWAEGGGHLILHSLTLHSPTFRKGGEGITISGLAD